MHWGSKFNDFVPICTEVYPKSWTPANILASSRIIGVSPPPPLNRQASSSSSVTPSETFTAPATNSPDGWTKRWICMRGGLKRGTTYDSGNESLQKCPRMEHPGLWTNDNNIFYPKVISEHNVQKNEWEENLSWPQYTQTTKPTCSYRKTLNEEFSWALTEL